MKKHVLAATFIIPAVLLCGCSGQKAMPQPAPKELAHPPQITERAEPDIDLGFFMPAPPVSGVRRRLFPGRDGIFRAGYIPAPKDDAGSLRIELFDGDITVIIGRPKGGSGTRRLHAPETPISWPELIGIAAGHNYN